MKDSARLQSVLDLLIQQETEKKPLDQVCHTYFKSRRYIGSKDRIAISTIIYGIMRHRASCDWWALERGLSPLLMKTQDAARIRLLAYLWVIDHLSREKFGILFSGEKYAPAKLSTKETSLFTELPNLSRLPFWIQYEYPEWIHPFLLRRFGDNLGHEMSRFLEQAPLDLRVNTLKTTREKALSDLKSEGLSFEPTAHSTLGLRHHKREPIAQNQIFQKGHVEVQDEGSQLIVQLMDLKPGQAVLDLCAGAGGKTLAIAAHLENKGRIVATDTAAWRLKRMKERLKRAGVYNAETREITGIQDKWLKRQQNRFDRVLVDAPCSGTGTWRRNPDQKWNLKPQDIQELSQLQKELLAGAAACLKPGGILVYATCSLLMEENEDVAHNFLETHAEFAIVPCGIDHQDFLSLSPHRTETDGFFAAKFQKALK